jgi:predicted nucleotidyltransferase
VPIAGETRPESRSKAAVRLQWSGVTEAWCVVRSLGSCHRFSLIAKPARQLRYGVNMVAQEVIEAAGQTLAAVAADPVKIVLFGSRARGDAGPDSDYDFLVVERDPQDRHAEMVRLGRALRPLGMPFDVVVVSERYADDWGGVEGSMVHAALTEGRVLHAAA